MESHNGPSLRISPFCAHLRTKKWFFLEAPAMTEDDILDGSGRSWCEQTAQSIGPDGKICAPETCRQGRACHESLDPAS